MEDKKYKPNLRTRMYALCAKNKTTGELYLIDAKDKIITKKETYIDYCCGYKEKNPFLTNHKDALSNIKFLKELIESKNDMTDMKIIIVKLNSPNCPIQVNKKSIKTTYATRLNQPILATLK